MSGTGLALLLAVMLLVVAVLVTGVFSMAKGGEFNRKYGNRLMRARVVLQGLALLIFAILMLTMVRD